MKKISWHPQNKKEGAQPIMSVYNNVWTLLQWRYTPEKALAITKIDDIEIGIMPIFEGDLLPDDMSEIDRLVFVGTEPWISRMSGKTMDAIRNLEQCRELRAAWRENADALFKYRMTNAGKPLTSTAYTRYAHWHHAVFDVFPTGWEYDPNGVLRRTKTNTQS